MDIHHITCILRTSVADAKTSLECQLVNNPQAAMDDAQLCIDFIASQGAESQHRSRLSMLKTIVNKAKKRLSHKGR